MPMRYMIDSLERRTLLSAAIDADGVLVVTGDSGKDEIIISVNPDDSTELLVKENGVVEDFTIADITAGIRVSAQGGKDKVAIDETNGDITLNATLYGGNGKDDLHGASGNDKIDGGTGKDRLFGNDGNDHMIGGSGNDLLDGGAGNDYLVGNKGPDVLIGGDGEDDLDGGGSRDNITGGAGNDDFVNYDGARERQDQDATDDGDNTLLDQPDADPLA